MGIKDTYTVNRISADHIREWCTKKHYAKKMPSVTLYTYGCYTNGGSLVGVALFGLAGNSNLNELGGYPVIELTRLVVNDHKEKNLTSYFLGKCLRNLPFKGFVVSFADANQDHSGYIYQATNFIYTGFSAPSEVYIKGDVELHSKTFSDKFGRRDKLFAEGNGYRIIIKKPKHRYFFLLNSRNELKKMRQLLSDKFGIHDYPKGVNQNYDSSYKPSIQTNLF